MDKISAKYEIKKPQDWTNVLPEYLKLNGGASILVKYNYSLQSVLQNVYPGI